MIKKKPFYKNSQFQWSVGTVIAIIAILVGVVTPEIRKMIFEEKYLSNPVFENDSLKETITKLDSDTLKNKTAVKENATLCYESITFFLIDTVTQNSIANVKISYTGERFFVDSYTNSKGMKTIVFSQGNEVKSKIRFENPNYDFKDIIIEICKKNKNHTDTTIYLKPKRNGGKNEN